MSGDKVALVTGASGFVGRNCLAALERRGFEVHAVTSDAASEEGPVRWHTLDLLVPDAVDELMRSLRPSHLLHLAWYVSPADYQESQKNLRWVGAGLSLAEAFAANGGRRCVMVGTCFEYDWTGGGPLTEGVTPIRPATLYGACKAGLHLASQAFLMQAGVSTSWAHLFYLYGPFEYEERFVPAAMRRILAGESFECLQPRAVRDYIHVEDAGDALVALLDSEVEGDVNVASGSGVSLGDLVGLIGEAAGRSDLAVSADATGPPGRPVVAAVERLAGEVGWSPHHRLETGLSATLDWWRERQG